MAVGQSGTRKPPNPRESEDEGAFSYPDRIVLSLAAERYLQQLAVDLATGAVGFQQLSPALQQLYVFAYEQGSASRQDELDRANWDADRLYAEVCRRPPAKDHSTIEQFIAARKHQTVEAAARRAAEIRDYIGGHPDDRYPEPDSDKETR